MEPRKRPGRPVTTGKTPKRNLRVGELWDEAAAVAEGRGETMTALVIRAVERELERIRREARRD